MENACFISRIIQKKIWISGDTDKLSLLISHQSASVKSRTCSLLGNLMKHNAQMYTFLKQREKLFEGLMACLKDEDQNVRKVSEASPQTWNRFLHEPVLSASLSTILH